MSGKPKPQRIQSTNSLLREVVDAASRQTIRVTETRTLFFSFLNQRLAYELIQLAGQAITGAICGTCGGAAAFEGVVAYCLDCKEGVGYCTCPTAYILKGEEV
jgi:hypothetical protein